MNHFLRETLYREADNLRFLADERRFYSVTYDREDCDGRMEPVESAPSCNAPDFVGPPDFLNPRHKAHQMQQQRQQWWRRMETQCKLMKMI